MLGSAVLNWDKVVKPGRDISFLFDESGVRGKYVCPYSYYPVFVREYRVHSSDTEADKVVYENEGQWALWRAGSGMHRVYTPDGCYVESDYYGKHLCASKDYHLTIYDNNSYNRSYYESRYAVPVSDEQIPDVALEHIPEWTPIYYRRDSDGEYGWGSVRFGKFFNGEFFQNTFDLGNYKFYYGPNEDPWDDCEEDDCEEDVLVSKDSKNEPDKAEDGGIGRFIISWDI